MQPTYRPLPSYDHLIQGRADGRVTMKDLPNVRALGEFVADLAKEDARKLQPLAKHLQGNTPAQTAYNVWHFTANNVAYRYDETQLNGVGRKEQPRTPLRTWSDRFQGVDCEDYSAFMASLLVANGLPCELRIVELTPGGGWQHIYPTTNGIVIDRLLAFGEEVKNPTRVMRIEVLSGLAGTTADNDPRVLWLKIVKDPQVRQALAEFMPWVADFTPMGAVIWKPGAPVTEMDQILAKVLSGGSLSGLAAIRDRRQSGNSPIRGAGHTIVKVLPAMVIGRGAFLQLIHLNVFHLASKLRLMYLTDEKAKKSKLNYEEWVKLRDRRSKVESTWFNLGGDVKVLKKAIAKGAHVRESDLGEPVSATAIIATAAPVLVGITAALTGVDFKKMTAGSEDEAAGEGMEALGQAAGNLIKKLKDKKAGDPDKKLLESILDAAKGGATSGDEGSATPGTDTPPPPPKRDAEPDKKPIWPWVVGGVAVLGIGTAVVFSGKSK